MSDLSADELTVLLIAAKGEPMMPIGRWRATAESLVRRKYLIPRPHAGDPEGFFNLHITAAGQKAAEQCDREDDEAVRDMVMLSQSAMHSHKQIRANAEQIAVQLVDLAQASNKVTGDPSVEALEKWARLILKRALEMLK
jgi:hypothetical protein